MYYLRNEYLKVHILDPLVDQARLGPRFCTGGYIYQVEDAQHGALLSGPEYPAEKPFVINGQGLPEVFQFTLFEDERETEEKKLIIGVGLVDKRERTLPYHLFTNAQVLSFCKWQVASSTTRMRMKTMQAFKQWSLHLLREIKLEGRTVRSITVLKNESNRPLPFRWFAHPFFALTQDARYCRLEGLKYLPPNPGFQLDPEGFIAMRAEHDWNEGCYVKPAGLEGVYLTAQQRHDQLGEIRASCDFPLSDLALWANDKTFSFEPFYQDTILPQNESVWSVSYEFGRA